MTKKEIVKQISDRLGLTQLKTKDIVQQTFDAIVDTLINHPTHRIELRNFGVFEVKKRKARKGAIRAPESASMCRPRMSSPSSPARRWRHAFAP